MSKNLNPYPHFFNLFSLLKKILVRNIFTKEGPVFAAKWKNKSAFRSDFFSVTCRNTKHNFLFLIVVDMDHRIINWELIQACLPLLFFRSGNWDPGSVTDLAKVTSFKQGYNLNIGGPTQISDLFSFPECIVEKMFSLISEINFFLTCCIF